ncbi:MAG TPA: HAMP domain-containing sensor histidine kinase [Candidatus Acidoferrales bacterium]|nr:HAMP domain-containing sensor histidine kinase [Candidatus Acidoferrales bacterium]
MNTAAGTARAQKPVVAVSLPSTIRQVVDELSPLITQRRAVVEVGRTAEDPLARGPEQAVKQILYHVLRNAVEASPAGGLIRVTQHQRPGQVVIEVSDEGAGIPPTDFSKIMRRGFSTKSGSKGQGLADVEWRLAELRGGISWESPLRTGRGACFTVMLPAAPAPQ